MSLAERGGAAELTPAQELALGISHCFNHELSIARIEEELPTLSIRYKLNKICISAYREEKVELIDAKKAPQIGKGNWRIVFELEAVT
jgi:hypothetical protein